MSNTPPHYFAAPGFFAPEFIEPHRRIGPLDVDFDARVLVMGIVNRTPDSYDQGTPGRTYDLDKAVAAARAAVAAGADIIDIGAVAFFNPANPGGVDEAEELDRLLPVVQALCEQQSLAAISVDTWRAEVARQALGLGAHIINDSSGLYDQDLADVVAEHPHATLIITHSIARPPQTPVVRPAYNDVVREVRDFLIERVELALSRGVQPGQLVIDPGHDLHKNVHHTLAITRNLHMITGTGWPTLVSPSNKHFIAETLGGERVNLPAVLATVVTCIHQGARIMRVHDVPANVNAVRMTMANLGWRGPAMARHYLA